MGQKNKHLLQSSHHCSKWRTLQLQMNESVINTAALYTFLPFTFSLVANQQQTLLSLPARMIGNCRDHNKNASLYHSLYLNPEYSCIFTCLPSFACSNLSSSLPHHLHYSSSSPTIRLLLKPFQMFLQISAAWHVTFRFFACSSMKLK